MLPQFSVTDGVTPSYPNLPDFTDAGLPLELLELELAVEGFKGKTGDFRAAVRAAAASANAAFLFDLPAGGLIPGCEHIAVIRLADAAPNAMRIVLACLMQDSGEIHVQAPTEETAHLVRFSRAFIDVFQRFPLQRGEIG